MIEFSICDSIISYLLFLSLCDFLYIRYDNRDFIILRYIL